MVTRLLALRPPSFMGSHGRATPSASRCAPGAQIRPGPSRSSRPPSTTTAERWRALCAAPPPSAGHAHPPPPPMHHPGGGGRPGRHASALTPPSPASLPSAATWWPCWHITSRNLLAALFRARGRCLNL